MDVKILTKALGNRLKEIVKEIISTNQQFFIQGRYLGNSVMDLYAAAATALEQDENYLAISLDIEKAFDSVNWDFLYKLLSHMGFPLQFIHWVQTLHRGKELRIFNNGHSSQPIQVSNGLAQGCSLSPLLFIFCMESLARVIKGSPLLKGVECQGVEKRVGMVADDTMLFLKTTAVGIQEIENILLAFEKTVGLKVNFEKTIIYSLGDKVINYSMSTQRRYQWLKPGAFFRYLGLLLGLNENKHIDGGDNFHRVDRKLNTLVRTLRYSRKSLLGCILLVKTMLASKFVYMFSLLPSPHNFILNKLDQYYYLFVWSKGRHRIAKTTMEQDLPKGGFKMLNVYKQEKSLKI